MAKQASDLGNQHYDGPGQDQIVDNPSALFGLGGNVNLIQLREGPLHPVGFYERSRRLLQ